MWEWRRDERVVDRIGRLVLVPAVGGLLWGGSAREQEQPAVTSPVAMSAAAS
jgi:hypothetical protein